MQAYTLMTEPENLERHAEEFAQLTVWFQAKKRQLGLDDSELVGSACESDFPTFVTTPWLQRIKPGDPNDPLLLQVLPQADG